MAYKAIVNKGMDALQQQLLRAERLAEVNALSATARAGAAVYRDAVADRAPVRSGNLARHIVMRSVKRTRRQSVVHVGAEKEAAYAMPLEFGHAIVVDGKVVGHVPAQPFMRPAYDENEKQIERAMQDEARRQAAKALRP